MQDNPTHSEQAEANRIAASLEAKPKKSSADRAVDRAEAKRRKAIKSQPPLEPAPLAESIQLHGDTLVNAKAADEEAARLLYVASIQAIAERISAEFVGYNDLSTRVEEVRADYERLNKSKVTFKHKFTADKVFREDCRKIREFFSTRRLHEFLVGADKTTHYSTAIDYFDGECNVSAAYIRKLAADFNEVGKLLLLESPPSPPKEKKVDYTEAEKYGAVSEKTDACNSLLPVYCTHCEEVHPPLQECEEYQGRTKRSRRKSLLP